MLRREVDELAEVLGARRRGDAHAARGVLAEVRVAQCARLRVPDVLPVAHAVDERRDRVLARLLAEDEALHVVREQRRRRGRAVQRLILGGLEDLRHRVARELVEGGDEQRRGAHLAREVDDALRTVSARMWRI